MATGAQRRRAEMDRELIEQAEWGPPGTTRARDELPKPLRRAAIVVLWTITALLAAGAMWAWMDATHNGVDDSYTVPVTCGYGTVYRERVEADRTTYSCERVLPEGRGNGQQAR